MTLWRFVFSISLILGFADVAKVWRSTLDLLTGGCGRRVQQTCEWWNKRRVDWVLRTLVWTLQDSRSQVRWAGRKGLACCVISMFSSPLPTSFQTYLCQRGRWWCVDRLFSWRTKKTSSLQRWMPQQTMSLLPTKFRGMSPHWNSFWEVNVAAWNFSAVKWWKHRCNKPESMRDHSHSCSLLSCRFPTLYFSPKGSKSSPRKYEVSWTKTTVRVRYVCERKLCRFSSSTCELGVPVCARVRLPSNGVAGFEYGPVIWDFRAIQWLFQTSAVWSVRAQTLSSFLVTWVAKLGAVRQSHSKTHRERNITGVDFEKDCVQMFDIFTPFPTKNGLGARQHPLHHRALLQHWPVFRGANRRKASQVASFSCRFAKNQVSVFRVAEKCPISSSIWHVSRLMNWRATRETARRGSPRQSCNFEAFSLNINISASDKCCKSGISEIEEIRNRRMLTLEGNLGVLSNGGNYLFTGHFSWWGGGNDETSPSQSCSMHRCCACLFVCLFLHILYRLIELFCRCFRIWLVSEKRRFCLVCA